MISLEQNKHFLTISILTVLLTANLMLPGDAEQINVRNQPFKGSVVRESGKIWVEFKTFAEALDIKFRGDEQSGFLVSKDPNAELPGAGKVLIDGTELENIVKGPVLVELNQASKLLGARLVVNKQLDSIDISLMKARVEGAASTGSLERAAYTLIEFGSPGESHTQDIQPAIAQVKSEFKNVQHTFCNIENEAMVKRYLKYKIQQDRNWYPEVVLLDRQGNIVFQLRGNHVIAGGLVKEMRKKVKSN